MVDVEIPRIRTVCELNDHSHWRARFKRSQDQKIRVLAALRRTVVGQMMVLAPLDVTLTRIAPSAGLDVGDNLPSSQKFVRDQVAAMLGIDDRDPRVRWHYAQERGEWGVRIRIEPAATLA